MAWKHVATCVQSENQPISSFNEKIVIEVCQKNNDSCIYFQTQHMFTKCLGIRGSPGSGNTWTMEYMVLYSILKGLIFLTTAMIAKRSNELGGKHWHYLFLPTDRHLSSHMMADISLTMIMRNQTKYNILLTPDISNCDEVRQALAEFLSIIDIMLRILKKAIYVWEDC